MSIFEALMMLGFGLAWPFNISRSLRTKTAAGKSFLFMITIEFAYVCGMIHKILHNFDWVFWLYVLNFVMVLIDTVLMIRYTKLDIFRKRRAELRARKHRQAAH
ncbi:hypothetical protein [Candidatus Avelusimicrobium alvi]|uniref:hypothetical protein n=1 Tax=Candidatus Avelusimicrobium alvi TaxID=3416221 RepID=UPI003D0B3821